MAIPGSAEGANGASLDWTEGLLPGNRLGEVFRHPAVCGGEFRFRIPFPDPPAGAAEAMPDACAARARWGEGRDRAAHRARVGGLSGRPEKRPHPTGGAGVRQKPTFLINHRWLGWERIWGGAEAFCPGTVREMRGVARVALHSARKRPVIRPGERGDFPVEVARMKDNTRWNTLCKEQSCLPRPSVLPLRTGRADFPPRTRLALAMGSASYGKQVA